MIKRIFATMVILALVMSSAISLGEPYKIGFGKATTRLKVRKSGSKDATIVGVYPEGALIQVIADEGDWLRTPMGYVFKKYVAKFDGYLVEGGFESQGTFYTEDTVKHEKMKNLKVHYLGRLTNDQLAEAVTSSKPKEIKAVDAFNYYSLPIYDVIGEYAYFPIGRDIYKLNIHAFHSIMWVGEFGTYGEVVTCYRTDYSSSSAERKFNIAKVSWIINGAIVESGEKFSYNKTTGPRDKKAGYKEATVFKDGEKVKGYGGGVCQVSTTIYCAVLNDPGLKVKERHAHSLEVTYVPYGKDVGMDATVSYGGQDFVFKNEYDFDIEVNVFAVDGTLLVIIQRV